MHWHRDQKGATSNHGQGRSAWVSYRCQGQRGMNNRVRKKDERSVPWRKKPIWKVKPRNRTKAHGKIKEILVGGLDFELKEPWEKSLKRSAEVILLRSGWTLSFVLRMGNLLWILSRFMFLRFTRVLIKKTEFGERKKWESSHDDSGLSAHALANTEITKLNNKHASLCWGSGIQEQLIWSLWLRTSQRVNEGCLSEGLTRAGG